MEEYDLLKLMRKFHGENACGCQTDDASSRDCPAHRVKQDCPQVDALQQALAHNQVVEVAYDESAEALRSDCTDSQLEVVLHTKAGALELASPSGAEKQMGYLEDA